MEDVRLILGDSREVLPTLPADSADALVTDPPAGIAMMGMGWDNPHAWRAPVSEHGFKKGWSLPAPTFGSTRNPVCKKCRRHQRGKAPRPVCDCPEPAFDVADNRVKERGLFVDWLTPILAECLRVCRPGAVGLVWALPRTSHWTALAIEESGWVLCDKLLHLFGCLSDDTEILTERGWEHYQKIETGSLALAYNVGDDTFGWEPIQDVFTYDYCDTAYRIRSDHTDQIVSRNHRCLVERGGSYAFQYAETLEQQARVPVLEDVPDLLGSLPLPRRDPGTPEPGLLVGVCAQADWPKEHGEGQETGPGLSAVRDCLPAEGAGVEGSPQVQVLRHQLCGGGPGRGPEVRRALAANKRGGEGRVDGGFSGVLPGEDEWREQSGVEGRGNVLPQARQLREHEVRPLSGGLPGDGAAGRLRRGAPPVGGSGRGTVSDARGDGSSQGPRPDEQRALQPNALCQQPGSQTVRASRFTRTDLARVEPVHYRGVVWCVRVASGAFVARRNGKVFVTGNSGFPKGRHLLKPAYEEWWLCRKPGPLWLGVGECKVGTEGTLRSQNEGPEWSGKFNGGQRVNGSPAGRWPANLLLSHISPSADSPGCRLVGTRRVKGTNPPGPTLRGMTGWETRPDEGGKPIQRYAGPDGTEEVEHWECDPECPIFLLDRQGEERGVHPAGPAQPAQEKWAYDREGANCYADGTFRACGSRVGDRGGPSRFFYCAKASKADRGEGNKHPCVKPSALMEWLCRLACPAGGLILDPFAGSGSTGVAAVRAGRRFLGIEQDAAYHATAAKRLVEAQGPLFAGVSTA